MYHAKPTTTGKRCPREAVRRCGRRPRLPFRPALSLLTLDVSTVVRTYVHPSVTPSLEPPGVLEQSQQPKLVLLVSRDTLVPWLSVRCGSTPDLSASGVGWDDVTDDAKSLSGSECVR